MDTGPAGVAVVTGAGRGLGRGIALALATGGFDLVLGWASDQAAVEATAAAATATASGAGATASGAGASGAGAAASRAGAASGAPAGAAGTAGARIRAITVQGDVADAGTAKLLLDAALSLGRLAAWVNNAAVSVLAPVLGTDPAAMARMVEVNLLGTFHGIQAAGRCFVAQGTPGRIVNLASDLGVQAAVNMGGYSATKFAVVGLTQAAAVELAPAGITVNAVCPGTAETGMVLAERASEVTLRGETPAAVRRRYLDAIPAGRFCTPEDVGAVVAWLCGPTAAYVTGQAICVNGGSVLH